MSKALSVDVVDSNGKKAGSAELPAALFGVEPNIPLIHQVVVAQLAAARQGTHKAKTRGEVRGGGAKPWRQKGTGRARQGSRRAPQWTGGGVVHGPVPRDYSQRTPKKMIAAALRGALSDRAADGNVHVINNLVEGDVPSTKQALAALAAVAKSNKVLVVLHRDEDLAWLSLRNAHNVHVLIADQLNAYDVLVSDEVVFTAAALDSFVSGPAKASSAKATETEAKAEPTNAELAAAETAASDEDTSEPTNAELAADEDQEESK
ncbi:50S ribosomal protein L4 [Ammonicoccus fulvus]|uniref:Large ribosomal subunit protein uL4 n=1 Tax=Ammonicoccus fulvus TaxID=3138240 RepID=A0ABZ3FP77_9ACTN